VNRNFFENRPQTVLIENGSRAVALMNIVVDYQYLSDKTFSLMEITCYIYIVATLSQQSLLTGI
jgi:hypothetical protein